MDQLTVRRLENLVKANDVRLKRSEDKDQIRAGRMSASVVFKDLPQHWRKATLVTLLLAVPYVGRRRATAWARSAGLDLSRRLDTLTMRQRQMLAEAVTLWTERRIDLTYKMATVLHASG